MHIQTIRSIANGLGIKSGKLGKTELIRSIQSAEGNFDCFGSANDGYCDQYACSWREDCLPAPVVTKPKAAAPAKKKSAAAATAAPAKPKAASKPKAAAKPKAAKAGKTK